jgi:hypothetical protein
MLTSVTPNPDELIAAMEALARSRAVGLIAVERRRQQASNAEAGAEFSREHDAQHTRWYTDGEVGNGAWPWDGEWWKPNYNDPVRNLVKAGALIAAEIDRVLARRTNGAVPITDGVR